MRCLFLFLCKSQAFIAREVFPHLAHPQARKPMQDDQARLKKGLRDQLYGFSGAIAKFKVPGMLREGSEGSGRAEEMKMA
jgi:hypothetical protein